MTVTYTAEVATCRGLGCFLKLLRRWRGSIYKLVWFDLIVFLSFYYALNLTYRLLLNDHQKTIFESVVRYCKEYSTFIPLSFVLGFYVSIVMARWWKQYTTIPFPDSIAVFVSATVHGQDERGRVMRRTIMRYVCLCVSMMFTMIAPRVKRRFPTLDHFVDAGLLQQNERDIMAQFNLKFPKYSKHWMPIVWAASIITRARKEGRIRDDFAVKTILDELNKLRGQCGLLLSFDSISVPLVYTQVVTLAVYSYFLTTLMGHQWVKTNSYTVDLYFPVFTTLQFFFYVGWLKVAETLINPFGDDDDDFEINWMIDRNLQVSYLIVDEMHHEHPELVRDQYWDEVFPQELPYTLASEPFREHHPLPSTAHIAQQDSEILGPSSYKIDDMMEDDMHKPIMFTARPGSMRSNRSQISLGHSVPDSIPRNNSVTSVLKRLFSREDGRGDANKEMGIELTKSNASIHPKTQPGSVRRITDEIIEEVDEQTTITSQKSNHDARPSVFNIFGPPTPSEPVSVPGMADRGYPKVSSAPEPTQKDIFGSDHISIGSDTDNSDDEFVRLKSMREQERRNRLMLNLARSLSNNTDAQADSEFLLGRRQATTPTQYEQSF